MKAGLDNEHLDALKKQVIKEEAETEELKWKENVEEKVVAKEELHDEL